MADGPKVLVVDDDKDFRESLEFLLKSHGYQVIQASSGREGLRKVVENQPDVILLDLMMESTEAGYCLTHSLRYGDEYAPYRDIPIIMISSIEETPDERYPMCPEVAMIRPDRYLTKPLEIAKLLELLRAAA